MVKVKIKNKPNEWLASGFFRQIFSTQRLI